MTTVKVNYEDYAIGTKIESIDKDGYDVMNACGVIVEHLGGGHAIIKTFEGFYFSTIGLLKKVKLVIIVNN